MYLKMLKFFMTVVATWMLMSIAWAARNTGFGAVAQNMLEPVFLLSDFVSAACFIIGGSFLFASIIKYIEHRRSPLMVPISTVIFLVIAGLLLVGMPFMWVLAKYVN